jgi:hypothetical protein
VELREQYKTLEIKKVDDEMIQYAIPYMSVQAGQTYSLFASVNITDDYLKGVPKNTPAYTFTASDASIKINGSSTYTTNKDNLKKGNNKISLNIVCDKKFDYDIPQMITVKDVTGKVVGQINILCSAVDREKTINLVKVYFGDNPALNNAKTPDNFMDDALQFLNRKRKDGFQTSGYTHSKPGYENYCVILNNASIDYTTYTHELGHVFGLEHPFYETNSGGTEKIKPVPVIMQGSSNNFMDYSPLTFMFWQWQWNILRQNMKDK